jgi:hypothetical protein
MTRKGQPFEMCRLRAKGGLIPKSRRWKVTCRYEIQISARKLVSAVRVRCFHSGAAVVMHFTETEFNRLFEKVA